VTLRLSPELLRAIQAHGEHSYPEEGAGLILGTVQPEDRTAVTLAPRPNNFQPDSRRRRYLITPEDMLDAEDQAEGLGLDVIGVFHSHPDHPAQASEFDREWAMPFYSYVITSVSNARAVESRSWRLDEGRGRMAEEALLVIAQAKTEEV
jgi:proteasome lid subunit RPN8/RPN11